MNGLEPKSIAIVLPQHLPCQEHRYCEIDSKELVPNGSVFRELICSHWLGGFEVSLELFCAVTSMTHQSTPVVNVPRVLITFRYPRLITQSTSQLI